MKAVAGFALIAAVHAAGWQDTPVDPAKSTTTTTTKPAEETQSYWGDVPVDPTTTTTTTAETWSDYDPKTTTTTKPVKETTTTTAETWSDWKSSTTTTKPVKETTTTVATWSDWQSSTTTTKPVEVTSTASWGDSPAPADPAQTWVDAAVGECKVVTVTKTGSIIWVPAPAAPTSADNTWADAPVDPTTTATWSDWKSSTTTTTTKPVKETTTTTKPVKETTTTAETWSDYNPAPTTTTSATWDHKPTTLSTSTKSTTTSSTPKPTDAVCPNDNGKTLPAAGSCGGSFQVNCGVKATPGAGSKFWQRTEGEKIPTLAGCLAICNENALCESVLYVQSAGSSDDQLCWQTSGLGPVTGQGYAQIAYKQNASGKCAQSYTKA